MICERAVQVHVRTLGMTLLDHVVVCGKWVAITSTPCHFGGYRRWFVCPACASRCAILYPHICRKCINGHYAIESLTVQDRKIDQAIKVRERLGQTDGGIAVPFPGKPKWMRWHSYNRLFDKSRALEAEIWAADRVALGLGRE